VSEGGPVVVCYDGSPESQHALREAAALFPGARTLVVHVWQSIQSSAAFRYSAAGVTGALSEAMDELESAGAEAAHQVAADGARRGAEAGLETEPRVVRAGEKVWSPVVELLDREDALVAVVGPRGLGRVQATVIGGFSGGLIHNSRRPVLVVPRVGK
jgi:nucleotide-binding universal stress UspA family protein